MGDPSGSHVTALADVLLGQSAEQRAAWLAAHQAQLSIALIEELKRQGDLALRSDTERANAASACALLVAAHLPEDPLADALANWARGNWASYHVPNEAILHYQRALAVYRGANQDLVVARLLANSVAPLAECGQFAEATAVYREAHDLLSTLGAPGGYYQLPLEQNYGWLLHTRGHYDEALRVHERARALAQQFDQPDRIAEIEVNRTLTLAMLGRIAEGEAVLMQCRMIVAAHPQTVARIDMDLGELTAALGRPADALRWLQSARKGFAAQQNTMELGSVRMREAELLEQLGLWREARRGYEEAEVTFRSLSLWPEVGRALVHAARAARREGRNFRKVMRLLDTAAELWQRLEQPFWLASIALERAELALATDEPTTAITVLDVAPLHDAASALATQRALLRGAAHVRLWKYTHDPAHHAEGQRAFAAALADAEQHQQLWAQREALAGLGGILLDDDSAAGESLLERAVAIDDRTRQALSVEELKAGFALQAGDLLPLLARSAIAQGQPLQALHAMWRAKGGALLDLLRLQHEVQNAAPALEAEIADVRQHLAAERWRVAREQVEDVTREQREGLDTTLAALEDQFIALRRRRNRGSTMAADAPLATNAAQVLASMNADLLIEYVRCEDQLLVVCADGAGTRSTAIISDLDRLLDRCDQLALSMQNVVAHAHDHRALYHEPWIAEIRPVLEELYAQLIAPLGPLPACGRLLIAPCAPITMLPFAALCDTDGYLGARFTLEMTPSGALLDVPPVAPPHPPGPPLIIAASAEGRLAHTASEAAAVHAAFPDSICFVDDPQSLAHLMGLRAAPTLLHIAAHTILHPEIPIFSALQLTGETLSVEQCYVLPLVGTALVTLSGCATASGLDTGGALLAFQSALFVAGAARVVSSLWPVDDEATTVFMDVFYSLIAQGNDPPSALQQTQRTLMEQLGYGHPAIWAAFTCSRR